MRGLLWAWWGVDRGLAVALRREQLWGREGGAEEWVGTQDGAELGSGGDTRHTVPRECGCVGPGAQGSRC